MLPLDLQELKDFRTIYLDISTDGIVLLDRQGKMKEFIESVREWAKAAGTMRIVHPDGDFHWVLAKVGRGEVVELGNKH